MLSKYLRLGVQALPSTFFNKMADDLQNYPSRNKSEEHDMKGT